MTERENIFEVFHHTGKAEWIPIGPAALQYVFSSGYRDRPPRGENGFDWFGCYWYYDPVTNGFAQAHESEHPHIISDITKWREQVVFPDVDVIDWETAASKDLVGIDRENKLIEFFTESGVFERCQELCGFENALIYMYEEPEAYCELSNAITEWKIRLFDKLITYYQPDAFKIMDDLGHNTGPLVSVEMYRKFIKPYDKRLIEYIHSRGVMVDYHSCGCMQDFVGDLVEIGADMIDPLQGSINNLPLIQEKYGDVVGFLGGTGRAIHDPAATDNEVRADVRKTMELFWDKKNLVILPVTFVPGRAKIMLEEAYKVNEELRKRPL